MASIKKFVPFVYVSDNHGDQQDPDSVRAFFKFCTVWKPKIRIHGGDNYDLRPLRKGAGEDEKRESMRADLHLGHNFLEQFKPTHYLLGNHEFDRLWAIATAGRGPLSDLCEAGVREIEGKCKQMGTTIFSYTRRLGLYQQGDLCFTHGMTHGVNAAKKALETYCTRGNLVFGHIHRETFHPGNTYDPRWARSSACMCKLDMPYLDRCLGAFAHSHGWIYGVYNPKTGENLVWSAKKTGDQWLLPTGIESL